MQFKSIRSRADAGVTMDVAEGHFAANHSHINNYIDLTKVRTHLFAARGAAEILAGFYESTLVEAILCLENTDTIGALMAEALSKSSFTGMNSDQDIAIVRPELNANNQMIFRGYAQEAVRGKNVLLLLSSISTGKTVTRAYDCLKYYGAILAGVCTVFSALREIDGIPVNAVFTGADVQDYMTYPPETCALCAAGRNLDALAGIWTPSSILTGILNYKKRAPLAPALACIVYAFTSSTVPSV